MLDVFDRYNFTVNEAEPLEKEVAIDPEMLGKVFENLIEENRRKGLGAYYTPREIVHYMCQESLVNHLATALNIAEERVAPTKQKQANLSGNTQKKGSGLRRGAAPRTPVPLKTKPKTFHPPSPPKAARTYPERSPKRPPPPEFSQEPSKNADRLEKALTSAPLLGPGFVQGGLTSEKARA